MAVEQDMGSYYARRAAEYERIYHKPERQADLRALEAEMPDFFAGRAVLEVACGTAWWTPHGARDAKAWLATDLNPETLEVARHKPLPACVTLAIADAWTWAELDGRSFDAAFAGHWWSHITLQDLPRWLDGLHQRLRPGAVVVFLDNLYVPGSSTPIARRDDAGNSYQERRLDDGSVHEVLKNFPTREQALGVLGPRARDARWATFGHYWRLSYELS